MKKQEAKIKDFTKQTGLIRDRSREQVSAHFDTAKGKVVSFNKSVSQKAILANKRALQIAEERRIIKVQERERALREIGTEKYPLTLNVGNHNKHIVTSHSYDIAMKKSYLYGDLQTAQELVNLYSKTGELKFSQTGNWKQKEVITANTDVGVVVNPKNGTEQTTNRFTIHYGKKGTHIVPAERNYKK